MNKDTQRRIATPDIYRALREADYELYRTAIESAEAVALKLHLLPREAAQIEEATVYCAAKGKGLLP